MPWAAIALIHPIATTPPSQKTLGYLGALLLGPPQYRIALNYPIVAHGLYGIHKTITTIGLAVDDPASFEAALNRRPTDSKQEES